MKWPAYGKEIIVELNSVFRDQKGKMVKEEYPEVVWTYPEN